MLVTGSAGSRAVSSSLVLVLTSLLFISSYIFHSKSVDAKLPHHVNPAQTAAQAREPMYLPVHSPNPGAQRPANGIERLLRAPRPEEGLPQTPDKKPAVGGDATAKKKKPKKKQQQQQARKAAAGAPWPGMAPAGGHLARKGSQEDNDEFLRLAMPKQQRLQAANIKSMGALKPGGASKHVGAERKGPVKVPKGGSNAFVKEDKVHDHDDRPVDHVWDL